MRKLGIRLAFEKNSGWKVRFWKHPEQMGNAALKQAGSTDYFHYQNMYFMKKTLALKSILALLLLSFFISNCKKDKTTPTPTVLTANSNVQAKNDEYKALLIAS